MYFPANSKYIFLCMFTTVNIMLVQHWGSGFWMCVLVRWEQQCDSFITHSDTVIYNSDSNQYCSQPCFSEPRHDNFRSRCSHCVGEMSRMKIQLTVWTIVSVFCRSCFWFDFSFLNRPVWSPVIRYTCTQNIHKKPWCVVKSFGCPVFNPFLWLNVATTLTFL